MAEDRTVDLIFAVTETIERMAQLRRTELLCELTLKVIAASENDFGKVDGLLKALFTEAQLNENPEATKVVEALARIILTTGRALNRSSGDGDRHYIWEDEVNQHLEHGNGNTCRASN